MNLIIQGQATEKTTHIVNSYLELDFVKKIIVSCWDSDSFKFEHDKVEIVRSEDILNPGIGNRNRQIITSLAGLKKSDSEISAKLRSDQIISNKSMRDMFEFYNKNKELTYKFKHKKPMAKIGIGGNFRSFPFHPRDHIFWGHTVDLINLFSISCDKHITDPNPPQDTWPNKGFYCNFERSETYLGVRYCSNFFSEVREVLLNPRKYLVDYAPKLAYTLSISNVIMDELFLTFPKLDIEWNKYGNPSYPYDLNLKNFGEYCG